MRETRPIYLDFVVANGDSIQGNRSLNPLDGLIVMDVWDSAKYVIVSKMINRNETDLMDKNGKISSFRFLMACIHS